MNFTIDTDNNITVHDATPVAQDNVVAFATEKELTGATAGWPISRLIEVWNGFAGAPPFGDLKPVKKFENRKIATARIWTAIQKLEKAASSEPALQTKTKAKAAKPTKPAGELKVPREGTAKAKVIEMLKQKNGATLDAIMVATGWQKHTVRGFISILGKKTGLVINSSRREDGARVYAVAK